MYYHLDVDNTIKKNTILMIYKNNLGNIFPPSSNGPVE